VYRDGSTHRTVVEARSNAMRAASIWPGGTSGDVRSPNYFQFLGRWLANDSIVVRLGAEQVSRGAVVLESYIPSRVSTEPVGTVDQVGGARLKELQAHRSKALLPG
jgi:hypothetical protein